MNYKVGINTNTT